MPIEEVDESAAAIERAALELEVGLMQHRRRCATTSITPGGPAARYALNASVNDNRLKVLTRDRADDDLAARQKGIERYDQTLMHLLGDERRRRSCKIRTGTHDEQHRLVEQNDIVWHRQQIAKVRHDVRGRCAGLRAPEDLLHPQLVAQILRELLGN
jgi:hypothetical protein